MKSEAATKVLQSAKPPAVSKVYTKYRTDLVAIRNNVDDNFLQLNAVVILELGALFDSAVFLICLYAVATVDPV